MRISDWSSDVCSSVLARARAHVGRDRAVAIDDDDAGLGVRAEDFAQPRRNFGGGLDAGKAAANHDDRAAPVRGRPLGEAMQVLVEGNRVIQRVDAETVLRSEEHTSELQSLMRISYAVFCLKKKKRRTHTTLDRLHNKSI